MKKFKINNTSLKLCTTENYIAESIEDKMRRIDETGEPIEAISPLIYTERKDGVLPETNIRTDRWLVAQTAMNDIHIESRNKRTERMKAATDAATATNSAQPENGTK